MAESTLRFRGGKWIGGHHGNIYHGDETFCKRKRVTRLSKIAEAELRDFNNSDGCSEIVRVQPRLKLHRPPTAAPLPFYTPQVLGGRREVRGGQVVWVRGVRDTFTGIVLSVEEFIAA